MKTGQAAAPGNWGKQQVDPHPDVGQDDHGKGVAIGEFNCWSVQLIQVGGRKWNGDGIGEGVRKERVKEQQSDCTAGQPCSSELCWSFCC